MVAELVVDMIEAPLFEIEDFGGSPADMDGHLLHNESEPAWQLFEEVETLLSGALARTRTNADEQ